ncbi:ABC transporter ATPase [Amycolatopsis decaplanina DSM 44594]|uniref:ABC transporter ATPase n=1 Tax=Amycolatopsis decaplanina DSM 44594 TaxID=1284240 RepID=M2ZKI5_9PSEU|nr:ABC transporter ATPase [Amycolatopsis decaplanina DSM 44594]
MRGEKGEGPRPAEAGRGPSRTTGGSETELVLEVALFQTLLDRRDEAARVGPVHQAVVVGQRQERHRPDGDRVVAVGVRDHDRALHDRAGTEHAGLRLHDDRRVEQGAVGADVRDREGAARQLVRLDLARTRAAGQVGDAVRETGEAELTRVVDDHRQQTLFGVHRDPQVHRTVVGDLLRVLVVGRVDVRVLLERFDGGLREERQERQVDALALLEGRLRPLAELGDLRDVHLVDLRELRGNLQRLAGLRGGDLPDPAGLLHGAAQGRELRRNRGLARSRRGGGRGGGGLGGGLLGGSRGGLLLGLGGREHVLLADAATDTAAGQRRQVDAVLRSELADQRRHVRRVVRAVVAARRGGLRRGLGGGLRRLGGLRRGSGFGLGLGLRFRLGFRLRLGLGFRLGLGLRGRSGTGGTDHREHAADLDGFVLTGADLQHGAGDRGRDLGVDLVRGDLEQRLVDLDALADLLEPPGDGALGDALAQLGQLHLGALAARSRRGVRLGRRGGLLLRGLRLRLGLRLFGGRLGGTGGLRHPAGPVVDDGELAADLDGLVFLSADLHDLAGHRGRDLGVDLVRGDLEQRLVDLDGVALLLQPPGDGALGDALTELRQRDGVGHRSLTPLICLAWSGSSTVRRQLWTCSGLPARARNASPRASVWVGCAWMSGATSSGNASQL